MPDKWEYPWFAAWDLAFHTVAARAGRHRLRQAAARPAAAPALPAPERAAARRTSGTSPTSTRRCTRGRRCFVYELREGRTRPGRPRLAGDALPEAGEELHLVGQPQGPRRAATCSRAASSAWTTSACSTAARRCPPAAPRPGRRHRLDGALLPEHAQIALELSLDDPVYVEQAQKFFEHFAWIAAAMNHIGRTGRAVGRGGRLLLRRAAAARTAAAMPLKVRSMVGLLPLCAATVFEPSVLRAVPELVDAARRVRRPAPAAPTALRDARLQARRDGPAAVRAVRREHGCAGSWPDARRGGVPRPARHPLAVALPPRPPVRLRRRRPGLPASATCRRSPTPACSAATPTGAGRCGSR